MKRSIFVSLPVAFFVFLIYTSCNKIDTTNIGSDLIPAVDNVHTFDTVIDAIVTDNFPMIDSTYILASDDQALGYISNDPAFGKTTASIYAYFRPSAFGLIPFADSITTVDSVVLSLATTHIFGDTNSTTRIGIYEVDQSERQHFKDSVYRISQPYFATSALLSTHDQLFSKINDADSIFEGAVKTGISNQIRIRLDNTFASRFINYDTAVYKTDSAFRDKFLGFALIPDSNFAQSNALAYINLRDSSTKLSFYYHSTQNGKDTALVTAFTMNSSTSANIVRQNRSGSTAETVLNNGSGDNELYIQSAPGTYVQITIPGLENISNRVIHRAELILDPVSAPLDNVFEKPSVLFLDAIDTAHKVTRTIQNDLQLISPSSNQYNVAQFGGTLTGNRYIFNLSRYIQGIVTRHEKNFPLRLYAPFDTRTIYVNPGIQSQVDIESLKSSQALVGFFFNVNPYIADGRVVLAGGSYPDSSKRIRLRIIYSRL